jgi:hypothetical protein
VLLCIFGLKGTEAVGVGPLAEKGSYNLQHPRIVFLDDPKKGTKIHDSCLWLTNWVLLEILLD